MLAWRARYEAAGLGGLYDEPRSGRPREIDRLEVITARPPCSPLWTWQRGKITGRPAPRHQEFPTFLRQIARAYPDQELHLIMDSYAAHKHEAVKALLTQNPGIHVHFTPTRASLMNKVECWFSMAERQAIHRGTHRSSVTSTPRSASSPTAGTNAATPWTKTADQILAKANRKKTSPAEH